MKNLKTWKTTQKGDFAGHNIHFQLDKHRMPCWNNVPFLVPMQSWLHDFCHRYDFVDTQCAGENNILSDD